MCPPSSSWARLPALGVPTPGPRTHLLTPAPGGPAPRGLSGSPLAGLGSKGPSLPGASERSGTDRRVGTGGLGQAGRPCWGEPVARGAQANGVSQPGNVRSPERRGAAHSRRRRRENGTSDTRGLEHAVQNPQHRPGSELIGCLGHGQGPRPALPLVEDLDTKSSSASGESDGRVTRFAT